MLDTTFNQKKAEAFSESLVDVLNKSAIALAISLGHRTGLFDAIANLPASTSEQIAEAAGLNERYVREWLGAMVTGRVINYNPETKTYQLPAEHAAFLTRAATPNNLAVGMQFIPVLGSVEDKILECFRNGGGVPYQEFPRFHEVMAEESGQTVLPALLDAILPLAEGIKEKLEAGIDVLDIGCGSGRAINLLAVNYPNSRFTGYDFSEEGISRARAETEKLGLKNVNFEVRDVAGINENGKYDFITAFDAIHDQAKPAVVLKEIFNALREDGTFLMQDIAGSSHVHKNMDHPISPYLYTISYMHCMTVSLANDGDGLGTMWGEEKACEMLKEAGFNVVSVQNLEHDFINTYYVAGKS
ncbi:MAG TPA: class I SAM-dependent methyltransferase [Pyrinomonadaceae bacterium]|nr:class I SAM-dependent methyltransferase [Pyrinomonadaceae bacterium]